MRAPMTAVPKKVTSAIRQRHQLLRKTAVHLADFAALDDDEAAAGGAVMESTGVGLEGDVPGGGFVPKRRRNAKLGAKLTILK